MKRLKILSLALALSLPSVTTWSAKMKEPLGQFTFNQKLFDAGLAISKYLVGFDKDILKKQCQIGTVYGTEGEEITLHGNGKASVKSIHGEKLGTYPLEVAEEKVLVYLDGLKRIERYEQKYKFVENCVQMLTYGTITLDVKENNTVQYVKTKILNKKAISYAQQRLFLEDKELKNIKRLADYNIKKEHVLDLKIHSIEALNVLFIPSNTKKANKKRKTFTSGMNVQGVCKNSSCRLYNQKIWVKIGYSQNKKKDGDHGIISQYGIKWFDFGVLSEKLNCVVCHKKLDETETIRFYTCKYKVKSSLRKDTENNLFHIPNLPNSIANKKEYWKEDSWKKAYAYAFDQQVEYKLKGEDKLCTYSLLCIAVEQIDQNDFVQNYDLT